MSLPSGFEELPDGFEDVESAPETAELSIPEGFEELPDGFEDVGDAEPNDTPKEEYKPGLFSSPNSSPEAIADQKVRDESRQDVTDLADKQLDAAYSKETQGNTKEEFAKNFTEKVNGIQDVEARKRWTLENIFSDDDKTDRDIKALDYANSIAKGFAGLYETAGWGIDRIGKKYGMESVQIYGKAMEDIGKESVKFYQDNMSEDAKSAQQVKLVGNSVAETIHNVFNNPQSTLLAVTDSTAGTAAGMAIGGGAAKMFKLIPGVGTAIADALGFGVGEGAISGLEGGKGAEKKVLSMPIKDLEKAPEFQALIAKGKTPEQAKLILADAAAGDTMALNFVTTTVLSSPMGILFGRFFREGNFANGFAKSFATGTGGEAAQETTQSAAETLGANFIEKKYVNPDMDITEGVAESALQGGLAGAAMGGGMATAGQVHSMYSEKNQEKLRQAHMREWASSFSFTSLTPRQQELKQQLETMKFTPALTEEAKQQKQQQIEQLQNMIFSEMSPEQMKEAEVEQEAVAQTQAEFTQFLQENPEISVPVEVMTDIELQNLIMEKYKSEIVEEKPSDELPVSQENTETQETVPEEVTPKEDTTQISENELSQETPAAEGKRTDAPEAYKDITQHPLYETVTKNARETYAKDTGERKGGGAGSWIDPETGLVQRSGAKGQENPMRGANLTKGDMNKIDKGEITPELEEKIRLEISRYQNDPLLSEYVEEPKSKISQIVEVERALGERGKKTKSIKPAEAKKVERKSKISDIIAAHRAFGLDRVKTKSIKPATKRQFEQVKSEVNSKGLNKSEQSEYDTLSEKLEDELTQEETWRLEDLEEKILQNYKELKELGNDETTQEEKQVIEQVEEKAPETEVFTEETKSKYPTLTSPAPEKTPEQKKRADEVRGRKPDEATEEKKNITDENGVILNEDRKPAVLFHGTATQFESFNDRFKGKESQTGDAYLAHFFTDSADVATQYATARPQRPKLVSFKKVGDNEWEYSSVKFADNTFKYVPQNIKRKTIDGETVYESSEGHEAETLEELKEMIDEEIEYGAEERLEGKRFSGGFNEGAQIYPVNITMKNPISIDMKGKRWDDERHEKILKEAIESNHDGVIFYNTVESSGDASTVYAVFSEDQIKNIFEKEAKPDEATVKQPGKGTLGKNSRGNTITEDERGVRSYNEGGILVSEPVGVIPDGGISVPADAQARYDMGKEEYLTTEEIAEIEGDKSKYNTADYDAVYEAMPTETTSKGGSQGALFGQSQLFDTESKQEYNVPKWAKKLVTDTTRYEDLLTAITEARTGNVRPLADRVVDAYYEANPKQEAQSGGLLDETTTEGTPGADVHIPEVSEGTQPETNEQGSKGDGGTSDGGTGATDREPAAGGQASDVSEAGDSDTRPDRKPARVKNQFTISQNEAITKGEVGRFNDNFKAIKLLKEDKSFYTKEELITLSKYTGWGGITKAFPDNAGRYEDGWQDRGKALRDTLTPEEYDNAYKSILDAFYTPPVIISNMWDIAEHLGFDGGNVLEPSVGTGRFIGMTPSNLKNVSFDGIELDATTSKIASILYPKSNIRNIGFEKTDHTGTFDMVVGNPPYGDFKVYDPVHKNLNKLNIHNYFMVKSLRALKPGGVVNFVITTSFMENMNITTAKLINEQAKIVGAIRLPDSTFGVSGTAVSTDIVIFQKLQDGEEGNIDEWFGKEKQDNGININRYFYNNPDMVLGEWVKAFRGNTLKARQDFNVERDLPAAIAKLPSNIVPSFQGQLREEVKRGADSSIEPSVIYEKDGKYFVNVKLNENTEAVPVSAKVAKPYVALRDALKRVITLQNQKGASEQELTKWRKVLNKTYDDFVKKNGELNKPTNRNAIVVDNYGYTVLSLEQDGEKAPIFTKRTSQPEKEIKTKDSKEALTITLNRKGNVDMDYLQEVTGKSEGQILKDLKGQIFFDVAENKYVPRNVFLSGDVKTKLEQASDPEAMDELLKVIPKDLTVNDIPVQIGAGWITKEDVAQFAEEVMGMRSFIKYNKDSGKWSVEGGYSGNNPFDVPSVSPKDMLEKGLNNKKIIVRKTIDKKSYVDEEATAYANQKQDELADAFQTWLFSDKKRTDKYVPMYNDLFNRSVTPDTKKAAENYEIPNLSRPKYDKNGKMIKKGFNPRAHQTNAVYRAVYGDSPLLLNHPVGSGKTLTSQMIAMEWRRLGIANKPVIATLKSVAPQFAKEFKEAYPDAKLLIPTAKDFSKGNRRILLSTIATGDFDAIIITHDNLKELQNPAETEKEVLEERIRELEDSVDEANNRDKKGIQKKIETLKNKYEEITNVAKNTDVLSFDQMGIDGLIVDESHKHKKIGFSSSMDLKGIDTESSQIAVDLLIKIRHIMKSSNNVVLMTGTPITNTLPELYAIQKTLQPELLKKQGIYAFDAWAKQYTETETEVEVTGTGKFKEVDRIKRYYNLDALYQSVGQFMDTVTNEDVKKADPNFKLPPVKNGEPTQVVLPASPEQESYIEELDERLKVVNQKDNPDNYLAIFGDASRMSLDIRFVVPEARDNPNSKANIAVQNAMGKYNEFKKEKGTQLIFSDLGIPNNQGRFDFYNDIKNKLIAQGVPESEIALIGDYDSAAKKKELSSKVNAGKVRFVIGSTQKLGTGINVQQKLVAVHHLDIPYTPAELEQRNGRIIRQGNKILEANPNFEIEIFNYATEKTLDGTRWQILKNKLEFIQQFQTGNTEIDLDIDEGSAKEQAEKMLALSSGNPLLLDRVKAEKKLKKLRATKRGYNIARADNLQSLERFEKTLETVDKEIADLQADMKEVTDGVVKINGKTFKKQSEMGQAVLDEITKYRGNRGTRGKNIGNINGIKIDITYDYANDKATITLSGNTQQRIQIDYISQGAAGMGAKIDNLAAPEAYQKRIDTKLQNKQTATERVPTLKKALKEEFGQQKELEETEEELASINAEMAAIAKGEGEDTSVDGDTTVDELQKIDDITKTPTQEENDAKMREGFVDLFSVLSMPSRLATKGVNAVDKIFSRHITGKLKGTKFDDFARRYMGASMSGLGMLSRTQEDSFLKLYRKMRGDLAKAGMKAEEADKFMEEAFLKTDTSELTESQVKELTGTDVTPEQVRNLQRSKKEDQRIFFDTISIRYLENPESRAEIKKMFPELAAELDKVRSYIDNLSDDAMKRGLMKPSQYYRWQNKYLSRLYLIQNQQLEAKVEAGIKMGKIQSGRKIESIVDWIAENPDEAQRLGVVLDVNMMVRLTIAKTQSNIAIEEFFRGVTEKSDMVNVDGLVGLSEPVSNLPKRFSPKYAERVIVPYIKDMIRNIEITIEKGVLPDRVIFGLEQRAQELSNSIEEIKEKADIAESYNSSDLLDTKRFAKIPDDPLYGSLAGSAMSKDIVSLIKSQVRIAKTPEMFSDEVDKYGSSLLAWFKTAKVPLNIFSYPRNLVSNVFQWGMSGADPATFFPEYIRALDSYIKKDKWRNVAERSGVLDTNAVSEEINKALDLMRSTGTSKNYKKLIEGVKKLSSYYGLIDDIAKIARIRYAMETDGKTEEEAVDIAQNTHYDYSLTYDMIRRIRDPHIKEAPMLKLMTTLFPTYTQKTIAFLYDTMLNRPATLALMGAALAVMIQGGNDDDKEEVGEERYKKIYNTLPEWIRNNPLVRVDMKLMPNGKVEVTLTDVSYVVPFGSVLSAAMAAARGEVGQALGDMGAAGSPLQMFGNLKVNKDSFTGREIYTELDEVEKLKDVGAYIAKQFAPGTVTKLISLSETKHPIVPRLAGVNTYVYNEDELARRADYAGKKALIDAGKKQSFYKRKIEMAEGKYSEGKITAKELKDIEVKNEKEIFKWRELGEKKSNELSPKSEAERNYKQTKWRTEYEFKKITKLIKANAAERLDLITDKNKTYKRKGVIKGVEGALRRLRKVIKSDKISNKQKETILKKMEDIYKKANKAL